MVSHEGPFCESRSPAMHTWSDPSGRTKTRAEDSGESSPKGGEKADVILYKKQSLPTRAAVHLEMLTRKLLKMYFAFLRMLRPFGL